MTVLLPIFAVILLGYVFRRYSFPGDEFWPMAERITYYVFFPCLLFSSLAIERFADFPVLPMAGAMVTGVAVVSVMGLAFRPWLGLEGPAFSSVFQGSIRPNTYVGIAVAMTLADGEGLALASIAIMTLIPLVNLLAVPVVTHFGRSHKSSAASILLEILKNPLIIACALGVLVNVSGVQLHAPLFDTLYLLGRASLPVALLSVGAGLNFSSLGSHLRGVAISSVFKLLLLPMVTLIACNFYSVSGGPMTIAILFTAIPVSASSFILARQLGGDEELMASIITAQTILAIVTLPLALEYFTA